MEQPLLEGVILIPDKDGNPMAMVRNDLNTRTVRTYKLEEMSFQDYEEHYKKLIK